MEISKHVDEHTCTGVNRVENMHASAKWIAKNILPNVKAKNDITPMEVVRLIHQKFQLNISYNKAWRGIGYAKQTLYGDVDDSYSYAEDLRDLLLAKNPVSHIVVETEGHNHSFLRMFFCFKLSIDGFLNGCRPFMGLDGCHLRGKYLGMLLSATALDGNNGLFPINFAKTGT